MATKGGKEKGNLRDRQFREAILLAEMRTCQEVADIISQEFHIVETRKDVWRFAHTQKGSKLVAFLKARFLKDLARIPIANKAVRLARLNTIYTEALTESLKSINQWGEVYEIKLGAAIEALKAARVEVEGEKPLVQINNYTQIWQKAAEKAHDVGADGRVHFGAKKEVSAQPCSV